MKFLGTCWKIVAWHGSKGDKRAFFSECKSTGMADPCKWVSIKFDMKNKFWRHLFIMGACSFVMILFISIYNHDSWTSSNSKLMAPEYFLIKFNDHSSIWTVEISHQRKFTFTGIFYFLNIIKSPYFSLLVLNGKIRKKKQLWSLFFSIYESRYLYNSINKFKGINLQQ